MRTGMRVVAAVVVLCGGVGAGETPEQWLARIQREARGEQRVLVILAYKNPNYAPDQAPPVSAADARRMVFGSRPSLAHWVSTVSSGQTWITGDVAGPYRVSSLTTGSDELLKRAAVDFHLPHYTQFIMVGRFEDMPAAGSGTVGRSDLPTPDGLAHVAVSTITQFHLQVITHEFGHNLGVWHANRAGSSDGPLSPDSRINEYGDPYDVMGRSPLGHFNAYHQERLGWLQIARGDGVLVTASGTYSIAPLEWTRGSRFLKIPLERRADGSVAQWYYVECRRPLHYDDGFSRSPNYTVTDTNAYDEIQVRIAPWNGGMVLDMDSSGEFYTEGLNVGATYEDRVRGVRITNRGVTDAGAVVGVEFTAPQPDGAPQVRILGLADGVEASGADFSIPVLATDERGISGINLYGLRSGDTSRYPILARTDIRSQPGPYRFKWDTTYVFDGTYTLFAEVTDTSYRVTKAQLITVRVNNIGRDAEPPTVRIPVPGEGQIIPTPREWAKGNMGGTTCRAEVSDNSLATPTGAVGVSFVLKSLSAGTAVLVGYEVDKDSNFSMAGSWFPRRDPVVRLQDESELSLSWLPPMMWRSYLMDQARLEGGVASGNYDLLAYARDLNGNSSWSTPVRIGIWNDPVNPPTRGPGDILRGDANANGEVYLSDSIAILTYLFKDAYTPAMRCKASADVNGDGRLDISDAIGLLNFLFVDGPPPAHPWPLPAPSREVPGTWGVCDTP